MQILILAGQVTQKVKELANSLNVRLPKADISVVSFKGELPNENYTFTLMFNENGWKKAAAQISDCTKDLYIVTEEEDNSLMLLMDQYNIKSVYILDDLVKGEINSLAEQYGGQTVQEQQVDLKRDFSQKKQREIVEPVQDFKLSAFLIAITGSKGGTGKTSVAVNLAAALAKAGKRVIVIDLDVTKNISSVADRLHIAYGNAKTVKDFIDGNVTENEKNLFSYHVDGFYVLPGAGRETEAKNLTRRIIKNILQFVSPLFDIIIVDLPHSLLSPMSIVLEFCDIGYVVVDELGEGLRTIQNWDLIPEYVYPKLKVIVNRSRSKNFDDEMEKLREKKNIGFLCNIRNDENFIDAFEHSKIPVNYRSCKEYREDFKRVVNDVLVRINSNAGSFNANQQKGGLFSFFNKL